MGPSRNRSRNARHADQAADAADFFLARRAAVGSGAQRVVAAGIRVRLLARDVGRN